MTNVFLTPSIRKSGAHVVHSSDIFQAQRVGGISRYVAELQRGLWERNIHSIALAGLHSNQHIRGVRGVAGRHAEWPKSRRLRSLSARVLENTARFVGHALDLVYHKTYYGPADTSWHGPVAVTVHDMIHELFPASFSPDDQTSKYKRWWCSRADIIFSVSHATKHDLVSLFGISPEKVIVTHLGVHPLQGSGQTPNCALKGPYLLYVGHRGGYKNFEGLLRAYAAAELAQHCNLVAFGGGPITSAESRLLCELGIQAHVLHMTGTDQELADAYRFARATVYPSEYEGFGLPPLEAMTLGCPVVCSNAASIPEVVGDAALLFDPRSTRSIASAVRSVCTDESARATLIERGYRRSTQFTWDRTVEATIAGYAAALSAWRQRKVRGLD